MQVREHPRHWPHQTKPNASSRYGPAALPPEGAKAEGRAVWVRADPDDLGMGRGDGTATVPCRGKPELPTGNASASLPYGVGDTAGRSTRTEPDPEARATRWVAKVERPLLELRSGNPDGSVCAAKAWDFRGRPGGDGPGVQEHCARQTGHPNTQPPGQTRKPPIGIAVRSRVEFQARCRGKQAGGADRAKTSRGRPGGGEMGGEKGGMLSNFEMWPSA